MKHNFVPLLSLEGQKQLCSTGLCCREALDDSSAVTTKIFQEKSTASFYRNCPWPRGLLKKVSTKMLRPNVDQGAGDRAAPKAF